jgi:hypothetical protein
MKMIPALAMKHLLTCLLLATTFLTTAQEPFELETYEENGKIGLLDEKGNKITPAKFDKFVYAADGSMIGQFVATFYNGLCSAYINQKVGFIDMKGKESVPFEYSSVHEFTADGLAAVEKERKWGFVNKKGKTIVPMIYTKAFDFENGKALVILDKEVTFIDVKGESTGDRYSLPIHYEEDNLSIIQNNFGRLGFLKGNVIFPNFYDEIQPLKGGDYFMVISGKKIGVIDMYAKEIIPPIYDEFGEFDGKYFYLWSGQKSGIIDLKGKIISAFIYDSVGRFNDGLAYVRQDADFDLNSKGKDLKYGFIDETGKEVIARKYNYASDFKNGAAKVRLGGEEFFINTKGERVQ